MELEELMRYRDYWSQRFNQIIDVNGRYRDRYRSDSSPVSITDSSSSEQGFYVYFKMFVLKLVMAQSH